MPGFPGDPVPVRALKATRWAANVIYTRCRPVPQSRRRQRRAHAERQRHVRLHQAVTVFAATASVTPDPARLRRAFATAVAARDAAFAAAT